MEETLPKYLERRFPEAMRSYPAKTVSSPTRILEVIGDPQDSFEVYQIAGTNGKGSTTRLIYEFLQEAGYKVGVNSNPIVTSEESRIQINGEPITEEEYLDAATRVVEEIDGEFTPSPYEVMFTASMLYFEERDIDIAVVETCAGGRLDVTNSLESDVNVITNVALDHTEELGGTREEIAVWIAGIVDEGSTVVCNTDDVATREIRREAEVKRADITTDWNEPRYELRDELHYDVKYGGETVETNVTGAYQEENVSTAVGAVMSGPHNVSEQNVRDALEGFSFPGRMEVLAHNPLTMIDGAHNPHAIKSLVKTLEAVERDVSVVFGSIERVDYESMAPMIASVADKLYVTTPQSPKEDKHDASVDTIVQLANDEGGDVSVKTEPREAFYKAVEEADDEALVLTTGSLYLCKQIRSEFGLV